jgi:hypothetical protein
MQTLSFPKEQSGNVEWEKKRIGEGTRVSVN